MHLEHVVCNSTKDMVRFCKFTIKVAPRYTAKMASNSNYVWYTRIFKRDNGNCTLKIQVTKYAALDK